MWISLLLRCFSRILISVRKVLAMIVDCMNENGAGYWGGNASLRAAANRRKVKREYF